MRNKETVLENKYGKEDKKKINSNDLKSASRLNLNVLLDRLKKKKKNEQKIRFVGYIVTLIILVAIILFYTNI